MHKQLFFLLFLVTVFPTAAQDSTAIEKLNYDEEKRKALDFQKNYIEELKNQEAFDYIHFVPQESWWTQFKKWLGNLWNSILDYLFGDIEAGSFLAFLVDLLPYLVVVAILAFAVWLFFKYDIGSAILKEQDEPAVFLSEDEEIIRSENIQELILAAKREGKYRLAVRYYFLYMLKKLSDEEIVTFENDKTNEDYQHEIKDAEQQKLFKSLSYLYDFIWYGDFQISESDFLKAEKQFLYMNSKLEKPVHG